MASVCEKFICGCTCNKPHEDVPDGPRVKFLAHWRGPSDYDFGSELTKCHCTQLSYVKWWGGGQWVKILSS